MNKQEFFKRMHSSISHINIGDNISEETLELINLMVDKVSRMDNAEINKEIEDRKAKIKFLEAKEYLKKNTTPIEITDWDRRIEAQAIIYDYIRNKRK